MLRILIVDDEYKIGQLISKLIHFDELCLELIDVLDDSVAALDRIIEEKPDIVISDVQMPVLDGLKMIEAAQKTGVMADFILVSGYREFEYARQAIKFGIEDYLLKPIKEQELNEVLKKICESRNQQIEREKETQLLKETAIREHQLSGRDALIEIRDRQPSSMEEFNNIYHLSFKKGFFLGIILKLDTDFSDDTDIVENRILLNTLQSLIESRLRPVVFEQLYRIKDDSEILGLINYAENLKDDIHKELQTAFIDIRQHTDVFPMKHVTMAIGDPKPFEELSKTIKGAEMRIIERIVTGVDRSIYGTAYEKIHDESLLNSQSLAGIREAAIAFDVSGLGKVIDDEYGKLMGCAPDEAYKYIVLSNEITDAFFSCFSDDLQYKERRNQIKKQIDACYSWQKYNTYTRTLLISLLNEIRKDKQERTRKPIREALDYIADHYFEKITQEDVCEVLGLNTSYFSTLFKKEVGENFQNYLTKYRMEEAKKLLRDTSETMASIAYKVGYNDTKYFSQTFARLVGMKPSLYRKMYS